MARSNEELLEALVATLSEAFREAQAQLLKLPKPLNAEVQNPSDLPAEERVRLLASLGLTTDFLDQHVGTPPTEADIETHRRLRDVFTRRILEAFVIGEEASEDDYQAAADAPLGSILLEIDAIDGTGPFENLAFGFGTTALLYRRESERDQLLFAAISNSSGILTVYDREGSQVLVGVEGNLRTITAPVHDEFHRDTVATLAARPGHRVLVRPLVDDPDLTLYSTGGAPAALGLVIGKLGALVAPEKQTTWDAACLPILSFLGIEILVPRPIDPRRPNAPLEPIAVETAQVIRYFSTVERIRKDDPRPVPQFVAARDPLLARTLFAAVFGA